MVIAGVLLLQNIHSPLDGAKKAAFAVVLSYFASFFCIYLVYFLRKNKISKPNGQLKPLLSSALPITAVRTSSSLLASAVAVLFPAALIKIGMSSQEAMANFGVVSGMVMPVLSTPATIIGSISLVLIPELSESFYQKNDERLSKNIERGLYSAVVISCFLIPFFFVLGEDLGNFLFSNLLSGKMIRICSFTLLPFSVMMISTGILNAIGKQKSTLLYFFIGSAGMLFTVLFLPSVLGIYAYPFGLFVSHTITSICNI
jgi:stage V sporulation protein B